MIENLYFSRFISTSDPQMNPFIFTLPEAWWWSRLYEYAWAQNFAEPQDVALDAASGLCHPFKFHLADTCKEVHACDYDPGILSVDAIRGNIKELLGDQVHVVPDQTYQQINFAQADLRSLPYSADYFDKVFCISVLEHLEPQDVRTAIKELARVVKQSGLLIITIDYPSLSLETFREAINEAGLDFVDGVSFELPDNAITTDLFGERLYCFRAALRKVT